MVDRGAAVQPITSLRRDRREASLHGRSIEWVGVMRLPRSSKMRPVRMAGEPLRRTCRARRLSDCRHSNQSLFAIGIFAGKRFREARDCAGGFGDTRRFRATETASFRVSAGEAAESQRLFRPRQKSSWQDSNRGASDYGNIR
jgi:hypothetical protein